MHDLPLVRRRCPSSMIQGSKLGLSLAVMGSAWDCLPICFTYDIASSSHCGSLPLVARRLCYSCTPDRRHCLGVPDMIFVETLLLPRIILPQRCTSAVWASSILRSVVQHRLDSNRLDSNRLLDRFMDISAPMALRLR